MDRHDHIDVVQLGGRVEEHDGGIGQPVQETQAELHLACVEPALAEHDPHREPDEIHVLELDPGPLGPMTEGGFMQAPPSAAVMGQRSQVPPWPSESPHTSVSPGVQVPRSLHTRSWQIIP